jgi:hypothetical protein
MNRIKDEAEDRFAGNGRMDTGGINAFLIKWQQRMIESVSRELNAGGRLETPVGIPFFNLQ